LQLIDLFYDELADAAVRRVPFVVPVGTLEYHGRHASCGTDTLVITGCLRELEKERELVVCPPIWYGVASYAVCGPRPGHFQVDEDTYADYIYCVVKSMVTAGVKNIYLVVHHQTEQEILMPMAIACHKAAKKAAMEYMEETRGKGWWGDESFAHYYEEMGSGEDPFGYVKVIALLGKDAQVKCGGFDHAGKWETSLLMDVWPEKVDLSRCGQNTEWFTKSAAQASAAAGDHMVSCAMEWLREAIV